jgi:hypothetical protein
MTLPGRAPDLGLRAGSAAALAASRTCSLQTVAAGARAGCRPPGVLCPRLLDRLQSPWRKPPRTRPDPSCRAPSPHERLSAMPREASTPRLTPLRLQSDQEHASRGAGVGVAPASAVAGSGGAAFPRNCSACGVMCLGRRFDRRVTHDGQRLMRRAASGSHATPPGLQIRGRRGPSGVTTRGRPPARCGRRPRAGRHPTRP